MLRTRSLAVAAVALVGLAALLCVGCARQKAPGALPQATPAPQEQVVLDVFVPCAFADATSEIAEMFQAEHPNIRVNRTIENVGVLVPRIANGAKPDVFMSIGDREVAGLTEKGLVDAQRDFCFTSIVLVVPQANPGKVATLKDLAKPAVKTIAVAEDELSVGYYSRKILTDNGVWDSVKGKLVRPKFPVELLKMAREGKVQASLAYAACFRAEGGEKKQMAAQIKLISDFLADYCLTIPCTAAVIKGAKHPQEAQAFLDFLTKPECQELFAAGGFMKLDDPKCFVTPGEKPAAGGESDQPSGTGEPAKPQGQ